MARSSGWPLRGRWRAQERGGIFKSFNFTLLRESFGCKCLKHMCIYYDHSPNNFLFNNRKISVDLSANICEADLYTYHALDSKVLRLQVLAQLDYRHEEFERRATGERRAAPPSSALQAPTSNCTSCTRSSSCTSPRTARRPLSISALRTRLLKLRVDVSIRLTLTLRLTTATVTEIRR